MAKSDKKADVGKKQLSIVIQGGLVAFLSSVLLIFLCSIFILKGLVRLDAAPKFAVAACAVSGFFCAFFTVKRIGCRALPTGLLVGALQFLFFLILGLLTLEKMAPGTDQLPLFAACLCSGTLAGLLAKKGRKKRHI